MQNRRTINILLVGDSTKKCEFFCHAMYTKSETIDFSINIWAEQEQEASNNLQLIAYLQATKNLYSNQEFAVICVDGATEEVIKTIEANKDARWVMKKYEGGDNLASVLACLDEVASSLTRPFFADVFKGKNSADLKGTLLEQIPAELHSNINNNLHYKFTEESITRKIPSFTTVFRGNKSRNLDGTHLELITTDLHPTINHYLLFQPRPKMERPKAELTLAELVEPERNNNRDKCIIN